MMTTKTTKRRLAVKPNKAQNAQTLSAATEAPTPVKVVSAKTGPVGILDKAKGYYKGLIAAVGSILVIVNELTPLLNFLPGQDKQYVTLVIGFLTTVAVFLKDNEHWVDDL